MESDNYPDCHEPSDRIGRYGEVICARYLDPDAQVFDKCHQCRYGGLALTVREELIREPTG